VYQIIKSKMDVTSSGDGYGMTGNVSKGGLAKLFDVLRTQFEFDETAYFMDLGHGMGRPTMHAAALQPRIAGSMGTEFSPYLYRQSMLALSECTMEVDSFTMEQPRTFFLDSNIKSFKSLNPFTHVYAFQIGMPEDVIDAMLKLIEESRSVKYAIIYPHRAASRKRLQQMGAIMYSQQMSMPGGSSYEVVVIKVNHPPELEPRVWPPTSVKEIFYPPDDIDPTISLAFECLADPGLYTVYTQQLPLVSAFENEQTSVRQSRGKRKQLNNEVTRNLEQSPCLPDINFGLLRRVAIDLGVKTTGGKVQILSNIQEYCPLTFGISMFAIGDDYNDAAVNRIVKTLKVQVSRRQPELYG